MNKAKTAMSTFTQGNLEAFFTLREGWLLKPTQQMADLSKVDIPQEIKDDIERCISIRAAHKSGYLLSIIAGGFLYCTPRAKATTYSEVEIGLIRKGGGLVYLRTGAPYFNNDVEGYVGIDDFNKIVKLIEDDGVKEYEQK